MTDDRTELDPADESASEPKSKIEEFLENDDLDDAIINADATGMVAAEHLITEAELREAGVLDEGNV
jgi:hypothetical protein